MAMAQRSDMMTDADLMDAIQGLGEQELNDEVKELLKMMSDNRIISWEEAEQIMGCGTYNGPIKSSLPPQTRPTEPDNDTDVDWSIKQLQMDDPKLKQVNLNNMKPIFDVVASNTTLKSINLETNYLSGDFFARLFKAALVNQTLEEVKAVNQGVTFATAAEKEIIDAVFQNRGLTKVSINLRLPEGRHKIENALIRNQEIRRILRRQAAAAAREAEEAQKRTGEANKPVTAKPEMQSRKPQPMKPAILGNASQIPFTRKQSFHVTEDFRQASTSDTSNLGKTPPVIKGNAAETLLCDKTTSTVLEKESIFAKHVKVPDVVNRTPINKVLPKGIASSESFPRVDPMKPTSKKTGLKRASIKAKTIDTTEESAPGKVKSKKTIPKKISLEQAVPEIELNTEEVLRKTSVSKKSSLAVKESFAPFGISETTAPTSTDSILSKRQNNPCDNSIKKNFAKLEKEIDSTVPVHESYQHLNKKPIGLVKSTRNSSLVPPIFLVAEQKNGPVKRNFSIPSKENSSGREKIAAKLNELEKSSLRSSPFSSPMPVYSLKRESNS
ncbi:hypothetical protein LOAG_01186 [Loa loa]|uniref:WH2 domain-containing protein n=1 Tax=Loa loa TaxID=7209 RepID=A0A1I7VQU5_LOALO|nr:hypothetical protein LOAG_01186 [Loa loa]EFO27303.1 hypothetical protein LOAG_01186 [Loa loa]